MELADIVRQILATVDEAGMTMGTVIAAISANVAFQTLCASGAISKSAIRKEIRLQLKAEGDDNAAPKPEPAFVGAGAAAEVDSCAADAPYVPAAREDDDGAATAADNPLEIVARALGTEPLAAREVAKLCGWKGRKSVNKHLYALQRASRAVRVDGSPPLWTAAGSSSGGGGGSSAAGAASAGRAEPLAKRQCTGEAAGSAALAVGTWSGASASADGGGSYYLLHRGKEEKRITVTMFGGAPRVDLRGWYDAGDGAMKPGRKGIMLSKQHWTMLMAAAPEITRRFDAL